MYIFSTHCSISQRWFKDQFYEYKTREYSSKTRLAPFPTPSFLLILISKTASGTSKKHWQQAVCLDALRMTVRFELEDVLVVKSNWEVVRAGEGEESR